MPALLGEETVHARRGSSPLADAEPSHPENGDAKTLLDLLTSATLLQADTNGGLYWTKDRTPSSEMAFSL